MTETDYKVCRKCNQLKPITSFPLRHKKTYREHTCGMCKKRSYQAKDVDRYRRQKQLETFRARAKTKGLSLEDYISWREERKRRADKLTLKRTRSKRCPLIRANKQYDFEKKEKDKAKAKEYYYTNLEYSLMKTRNWRHNNRAKQSEQNKRRDQSKTNSQGISHQEWKDVKDLFGNRCAYCFSQKKLTQDHFIPLSKGGKHCVENIVPACRSCNSSKGNKSYIVWLRFPPRR